MNISLVLTTIFFCFGSYIASAAANQTSNPCPLLGPDVLPPTSPSTSSSINIVTTALKKSLETALHKTTAFGKLESQYTSFSLDFYSIHEPSSLFTHHYSAPGLANPKQGVSIVDSDTVYRIGSVSKLWTVYLYLIEAGDISFNDPITKFVPELAAYAAKTKAELREDAIGIVDWEDITVGSLASHLAGVPRDGAPGPAQDQVIAQFTGLPPAEAHNVSFCGDFVQIPCNRAAFFADYLVRDPVVAPFSATPIYSNAAYQILGYVLENITSQSFPSLFNKLLSKLGTTSSSYAAPPSMQDAIIPGNASISWYSVDEFDEAPAGGYYSSINDLRKLGIFILNSTLLSPAQTRRWMKPASFTSNPNNFVGTPWEIYRAPVDRLSFIYSKSGDIGVYSSIVALLPDYDVGFSILAAGKGAHYNVAILADIVAQAMCPALETSAKAEARSAYSGTYTVPGSTMSSITVIVDSGPGLSITNWTSEGQNVFPLLADLSCAESSEGLTVRLYPSGLKITKGGKTAATAWRAVRQVLPQPLDPGAFSQNCDTWVAVDDIVYGIFGLDEFVFKLNENGKATSIVPKVLQGVSFTKGNAVRSRIAPMSRGDGTFPGV